MVNSFVAKYAPKQLSEVVFADAVVEQEIRRYIERDDMRPIILYGPNGTGKTTVIKLIAVAGMDASAKPPRMGLRRANRL